MYWSKAWWHISCCAIWPTFQLWSFQLYIGMIVFLFRASRYYQFFFHIFHRRLCRVFMHMKWAITEELSDYYDAITLFLRRYLKWQPSKYVPHFEKKKSKHMTILLKWKKFLVECCLPVCTINKILPRPMTKGTTSIALEWDLPKPCYERWPRCKCGGFAEATVINCCSLNTSANTITIISSDIISFEIPCLVYSVKIT
jgi:hypothetical protein